MQPAIGAGDLVERLEHLRLELAFHRRQRQIRLVAVGVVCWFAFQSFENIGMNLGIMPITGVPLPFMSYGGSAMFACWLGIGLLVNVHGATRASIMRS